jgi:hypothetical protein
MTSTAWGSPLRSTETIDSISEYSHGENPVVVVSSPIESQDDINTQSQEALREVRSNNEGANDFSGVDDSSFSSSSSDIVYDDDNNNIATMSPSSRKSIRWSDHEGYDLAVVHYSDRLHYSVRDDDPYGPEVSTCCIVC